MCESDGLSENEKPLPGEKQAERGAQLGGGLAFVTLFALIGAAVCTVLLRPRLPWVLLMLEALVIGVLGISAAMNFDWAAQELRRKYEELKHEFKHKQAEIDRLRNFISAFPRTTSNVASRLQAAAILVRDALNAQSSLYRGGSASAFAGWPEYSDEPGAKELRRKFAARETELETNFAKALAEFQRLRDLAKSEGFIVLESWNHYVGSPAPAVEGRNEPPGQ